MIFHRQTLTFVLGLLLIFIPAVAHANEDSLKQWRIFSKTPEAKQLTAWMHHAVQSFLLENENLRPIDILLPPFYGRLGVFITLVKKDKVRGCFGAFDHQSDRIDDILKEYLKGALRRDSRHQPLSAGEANDVKIILTIAGSRLPVEKLDSIDIARYGVLATFDNNAQDVVVPSEIRNIDALKKRWKGREITQIEAFRTVTIQ